MDANYETLGKIKSMIMCIKKLAYKVWNHND